MGSTSNQSSFDMNMSQSKSRSRTKESALSRAQLKILKDREAKFNNYFFPELKSAIAATDVNSKEGAAQMADAANQINASFGASENQINQNLAQQNLLGGGSGVQASLKAANARAKSSALAQAYYNTLQNSNAQKATLLGIGGNLMTQPTQSAAYHEESNQQSSSYGMGNGSNKTVSIL